MRGLVLLAVLAGCTDHELGESEPVQAKEELTIVPVSINRDLDLLFVIDDSCSMDQEQASLTANFEVFMNVLETLEGGLPNVHIGVVSSDLGVGSVPGISGCAGDGDGGELLVGDVACRPGASYIVDVASEDGGRTRNYPGTLADAFACNATLGVAGCGFEQHLESMRRALNGSNPGNAGFLRDDAYLAIVIIADEDDCSTFDPEMFRSASNFSCFVHGVDCATGNEDPYAPGPRTGCHPREDSEHMYGVEEYVDFLKSLKGDESMVLVSTIVGNPEPVHVATDPETGANGVRPSCVSTSGEAFPAIRLDHFAQQFPHRNAFTSICEPDLSDGMRLFAEMIRATLGVPCIDGELSSPVECVVSEVVGLDETPMARCSDDDAAVLPCWRLIEDRMSCPTTPTGLVLEIERSGASVAPGTYVQMRCRTE